MRKLLWALSIVLVIGFAAAVVAEAGLLDGSGTSPSRGLPYGAYRVSPLVPKYSPPPPPPPPSSGGVNIGGGSTPRLLRGGEVDNTDGGAKPAEPQVEKK
jgi:hypothetical protein